MTLNLHCTGCGRPIFGKTDMVIVQRLMSADRPLTAKELLAGTNVDRGSWKMTSHRVRATLAAQGYAMVNVCGFGPWQARYRLEKIED